MGVKEGFLIVAFVNLDRVANELGNLFLPGVFDGSLSRDGTIQQWDAASETRSLVLSGSSVEESMNLEEQANHDSSSLTWKQTQKDIEKLMKNSVYIWIVLGYACQTSVVGGLSFYGLKYAKEYLQLTEDQASYGT